MKNIRSKRSMLAAVVRAIAKASRTFARDDDGNIAIIFALMAIPLMLGIGAAVDMGRWLHARSQTMAAVDAAVLAGGRSLQTDGENQGAAIAAATKYYNENVTSRLSVTNDTVAFAVNNDGMGIHATGSAYIKTPFLHFASIEELPLIGLSEAQFAKSQIAVGGNGGENLEVSVMLDVTGSMAGGKLSDLKDAAKDLVGIVIWEDQSKFTAKVALVPFSEDIRLPNPSALPTARGTPKKSKKDGNDTVYLSDCVVERVGAQKYTDAPPRQNQYVLAHYTEQYTGSGDAKKGVCSVPVGAEIVALTDDKQALLNKIDGLSAAGGTAGHLGTAWAWYTLSPNWWGLWPSSHSRPAAYGTPDLRKIAILMTDGEYNTQYASSGVAVGQSWGGSCNGAANGCSTDQARALCSAMKAKGITVYTVGFEVGSSSSPANQLLQQCATDPNKFYNAEDGEELKQAFRDIALKLSSLYISK